MNKKVYKWMFFAGLTASVMMFSGCRSKPSAEMVGSGTGDNLYGNEIIDGDIPLPNPAGKPTDGDRSMFEAVMFAYDSSQVNPEEASKVEAVASYLKANRGGVIVEGHGDERGSREYNLALGERRALAIRDYLVSLGVDPENIQTKSLGEEMPVSADHTETAWRQNRRGVFAIYQ